jgi:hypothetical protein
MNGFAIRMPLLIDGIVVQFHLPVQLLDFVAGSIQDGVKGSELLGVEFDGGGKIGHIFLAPLLGTHLPGRSADIFTGLNRTDGIKPVGKRPKNSTAQEHQEQGERGGESGLRHDTS